MRRTLLTLLLLCLPLVVSADTIHVPGDQPTIQAGINAAVDGDIVLVADGTYTGSGNYNIDFHGKAVTVRSENGYDACTIDCQQSGRGFSFTSGEGLDSALEGFTIINGMAENGGAIYCEAASPAINGLAIIGCEAAEGGGGIYALDSSIRVDSCTIEECLARHGGGIMTEGDGAPEIVDSIIRENAEDWRAGGIEEHTTGHSLISGCQISDNVGEGIMCGGPITVTGNLVSGNSQSGIRVSGSDVTIEGNTIIGNSSGGDGGGLYVSCNGLIANNYIYGNDARKGGGMYLFSSEILVTNNFVVANTASNGGGIAMNGIHFVGTIHGNVIMDNSAHWGGGLYTLNAGANPTLSNNLVTGNHADSGAGMLCDYLSTPQLTGNTIVGNTATRRGGGLSCFGGADVTVTDSIFWGNQATYGYQLDLGSRYQPSVLTISHSDIEGGRPDVFVAPNCTLDWGEGMIDQDPLFVSGPLGDHYLSQVAAGQPETSPCVDAGDPSGDPPEGTTRTDERPDTGVTDMGFHYPAGELVPRPNVIVGLGPSPENQPRVRVFPPEQDASRLNAFPAYGFSQYGVNITCGDVDGDQLDEIITGPGPGPGYGPHVRGFEGHGTQLPGLSFQAYGTNKYGVNVAAGDLDGDGRDEIITGPGPGAVFGPHVRAFSYNDPGTVTSVPGVNFQAYATPKWGVSVAAGDIDGDGLDEIVTGAGPGAVYGAHVRGWNVDGGTAAAIPGVSFFAFNTPRYGVRVSCGDLNSDGIDEIVTVPGPSPAFAAHVRVWRFDGSGVSELPEFNFFAWPPAEASYGATVFAGADLDADGQDELVVGAGPDPSLDTLVRVYRRNGETVSLWFSLQAFPDGWTHGASVAAGRF
jgi:parallel beta-helix repeat protein